MQSILFPHNQKLALNAVHLSTNEYFVHAMIDNYNQWSWHEWIHDIPVTAWAMNTLSLSFENFMLCVFTECWLATLLA